MNFTRYLPVAATLFLAASPLSIAMAQDEPEIPVYPEFARHAPETIAILAKSKTPAEFAAAVIEMFQAVARGSETLTAADMAEMLSIEAARTRATYLSNLLVKDLDGDGVVLRSEMKTWFDDRSRDEKDPEAAAKVTETKVAQEMRADTDGDDKLTYAEMLTAASQSAERKGRVILKDRFQAVLAFDVDRDGDLSLSEVRAGAEALFALEDTDNDHTLSAAESDVVARQVVALTRQKREDELLAGCTFDRPKPGQRIAVIHARRGLSIARVSIAGQDAVTWSAAIGVEPGPEPIWILASADQPMLWHMEGADDRVAKLVVLPGEPRQVPGGFEESPDSGAQLPAAGVAGLAPEKIQFVDPTTCQLARVLKKDERYLHRTLERIFGRVPDAYTVNADIFAIIVPEGQLTAIPPPAAGQYPADSLSLDHWQQAEGFGRIPVVKVDPTDIVATGKIEPYEVLPGEAGIVELARAGVIVLRPVNSFKAADGSPLPLATRYLGNVFEIVRPIARFPADLPDGNGVTYVLAPGVPAPASLPRRSCVIDGVTGAALNKSPICIRK